MKEISLRVLCRKNISYLLTLENKGYNLFFKEGPKDRILLKVLEELFEFPFAYPIFSGGKGNLSIQNISLIIQLVTGYSYSY